MNYDLIKFKKSEALLIDIFDNVPDDCIDVRIGVRVYFSGTTGVQTYFITDYLYYGGNRTRVRFAHQDQQLQIWPTQVDNIIADRGWLQAQPSRRNSSEFLYFFVPVPKDEEYPDYKLYSKAVQ